MELQLGLHPDDTRRLTRLPFLSPLRSGKTRSRKMTTIWHDSPDRALAQQGLALAEQRPVWRLERLQPGAESWPPGAIAPALATARTLAEFGTSLPDPLIPVAAFDGRGTNLSLAMEGGPVQLTVLNGAVRAVAGEYRVSRVTLEGAVEPVEALATALAGALRLEVPRASLAAEAMSAASGAPPPARREGAPELPAGLSVGEAFNHVVGHLGDVILHLAPIAASGREGPEPVHQMRVAVRRLRSTIKVFRRAVACPSVDAVDVGLKALAAKLAPTRDWDVFVTETGAAVAAAFPTEARVQRLLAAAERRQRSCQGELRAFLGSIEFRRLGIKLACLAGALDWQTMLEPAEQTELAHPLEEFAARMLTKRLKKLPQAHDNLENLAPTALHAIRLRAKRLRYAAEIFAPLYATKTTHRFVRRLARLQDQLGALNDSAVAAGLLGELGGGSHTFATGLVLGFVGAHSHETRKKIDKAWQRFRRIPTFWE